MSNYPSSYDDDSTLPPVNNNLTELGADAINAVRDAILAIEVALGTNIAGSSSSLAARLGVFINPDGTPNASIIYALGLVVLPISNIQIAPAADIEESKLKLDYKTQDLFNYIRDLSRDVNIALGWISVSGIKLEPHLIGAIYRHDLAQIDVAEVSAQFLNNKFRVFRDNTSAYAMINDMNNELLAHQWADGSLFGTIQNVTTNDGSTYPSNYAHVASGIFLNTTRFQIIPQTATSEQLAWDFIDQASILTLGTRIQNLYANGISVNSRSSSLPIDGYGQAIIPPTPAIAYLRDTGNASNPFDDISMGDDIIQFVPSTDTGFSFDEQFALVRVGDIVRVNYANDGYFVEVPYIISEKKYISGNPSTFIIRIAGKNIAYSPNAIARIDKTLFNNNKQGVLAISGVNAINLPANTMPSLIVGSPRGAQCLGVGFSPDEFNETHYNLYLELYPDGNPLNGGTILPAIDVTGNLGITPGSYTLDSIVAATNLAFRQPGFNYRFIAFEYEGEFGIMLADSYNNVSFSIISGIVDPSGTYNKVSTQFSFPNNVIDLFPIVGIRAPDPLGFGPFGAGLASPQFLTSYGSAIASQTPTIIFPPLRRNNFYVNGAEQQVLNAYLGDGQLEDLYGDGYWAATISAINSTGIFPSGHIAVTYSIPLDLSASGLKAGKTLVVQQLGSNNLGLIDYGRFIIQSVTFSCCPPVQTEIVVYDAVHAIGGSPSTIAAINSQVAIYFSSDSVSFNEETVTDVSIINRPFKRHFEAYVDGAGNTFTHERGRLNPNGSNGSFISVNGINLYGNTIFSTIDIISISSKLRGYQFGNINKINLNVSLASTGIYTGYLSSFDGVNFNSQGPAVSGKLGEITRFYDNSNIDFIDVTFSLNTAPFIGQYIDIQLFPTLSLDEEIMLLGSCEVNMANQTVSQFVDLRQFGNTSEEQLTTSALDLIALPEKLLHFNGIIRGFDFLVNNNTQVLPVGYATGAVISLDGGLALVNGEFNSIDSQIFLIPALQEIYSTISYPINYLLCVNSEGDLITIILTDFDSVLGTPNQPGRIVTVKNKVSTNTYQVDSSTFSNILNNRKDLTPLYIISATVSGSGSSSITTITNTRDVRRYVNDSDSNIPAVLTSDNSQGNFKDITAALNWLKFNSGFQDVLQVKGTFVVPNDPGLTFPLIIGAGGATSSLLFNTVNPMTVSNITVNSVSVVFVPAIIASNTNFNNTSIIFSSTLTATNVNFTNCTVTITGVGTLTNVNFTNCTVIFNAINTLTNVNIGESTVTFGAASTLTNVNIESSIITIAGTNGLNISQFFALNTDFTITTTKGFNLGSFTSFDNCTFSYFSVNPIGVGSYNTNDLVNASSGMLYANIINSLTNISITKCSFYSTLADHFPFISFQFPQVYSVLQEVNILNNAFISLITATNDLRAVVSFVGTNVTAASSSLYPKAAALVNVTVDGNICNQDQMIILTGTRNGAGIISNSPNTLLSTTNVSISSNTCGTIGFITDICYTTDTDNTFNTVGSGAGFVRNKKGHLVIEKNTCKLITNLDSQADYIPFCLDTTGASTGFPTSTDIISYVIGNTGACSIVENAANWIQVGCFGTDTLTVINDLEGIIITKNRLSPANPTYLTNFLDDSTGGSGASPSNVAILLRRESSSDDSGRSGFYIQNIIDSNTISPGDIIETSGLEKTPPYTYLAGIVCYNNANMVNNVIGGGVVNSGPLIWLWGDTEANQGVPTPTINVHGNILDRAGVTIQGYIVGAQPNAFNTVTITNNIFDTFTIDGINENVGVNISSSWTFHSNKNQTGYVSIPITDFETVAPATPIYSFFNPPQSSISRYSVTVDADGYINLKGNLSKYIPIGVSVLYTALGFSIDSLPSTMNIGGNNTTQYSIWLDKVPNFSTAAPPTSFIGSLLDNISSGYITNVSTSISNILNINTITPTVAHSVTQYMWTDLTASSWTTRLYQSINIEITGQFSVTTAQDLEINYSPLLIKYRW